MTEQVEVAETSEEQPQETPEEVSTPESAAPLPQGSQEVDVLKSQIEALTNEVRGLQGRGDKNAEALGEVTERLGKLALTPEQKVELDKMTLEDRLVALEGGKLSPPADGAVTPETEETVDFAGVFREHGFDLAKLTDEQINAALVGKTTKEVNNVVLKMKAGQPPTPASTTGLVQPAGGGEQQQTSGDPEALAQEYQSLHGKPSNQLLSSGQTVSERQNEIAKELKEIEDKGK